MLRALRSIIAAAALATGLAAAAIAVPAAPAAAAVCGTASGVTVVVDPQQLDGGVRQVCDAGGAGKTAASIFEDSGFHQSYSPNGMVCQINSQPLGDVCRHDPPATAYWSLWWSDGTSGWVYASTGAGSLKIPAGGSVAWTWQGQATKHMPSIAPARKVAATPTPAASTPSKSAARPPRTVHHSITASAAPQATTAPDGTAAPSLPATPSASATARPKRAKHTPSATPSASDAAAPAPSPTTSADSAVTTTDSAQTSADAAQSDGLPGWVPPVVIAALALVAAGVALARRRKV